MSKIVADSLASRGGQSIAVVNDVNVTGIVTANGANFAGIVTATAFVDDGTDLLTEINTKTTQGKAIAMAMVFG